MINLSTGAFYERSTSQIGGLRAQAETLQQQIGTGERLQRSSDDPVAAAKVSVEFSKKNEKLIVLGGALGSEKLDVNGVKALATLPSLDELRGTIVGLLQAPASKIAQVLQAPGGQVARVISAYSEQGEKAA